MRRRSKKYVVEGSKYAHWIGLYLSFHSNWVLGPFVHVQNLETSEVTFAHVITPLSNMDERGNIQISVIPCCVSPKFCSRIKNN